MMKKLFMAVLFVFVATIATAQVDRNVQVTFSYNPLHAEYEATGFKVYVDGGDLCTVDTIDPGPPTSLVCEAGALVPGIYDFTLTAIYANGNESPASDPYAFEILPGEVAPLIITIEFG